MAGNPHTKVDGRAGGIGYEVVFGRGNGHKWPLLAALFGFPHGACEWLGSRSLMSLCLRNRRALRLLALERWREIVVLAAHRRYDIAIALLHGYLTLVVDFVGRRVYLLRVLMFKLALDK